MLESEGSKLLDKHIIKNIYIIIEVLGTIKVCADNSKMFSGRPFWESIDDVNYFRDTYLETLVSDTSY